MNEPESRWLAYRKWRYRWMLTYVAEVSVTGIVFCHLIQSFGRNKSLTQWLRLQQQLRHIVHIIAGGGRR